MKLACCYVLSLAVLTTAGVKYSFACGPGTPTVVFSFQNLPDYPLNRFAEGKLGILSPNFSATYLVVAYRYLSGKGLGREEQLAALSLWNATLTTSVTGGFTAYDIELLPQRWAFFRSRALNARDESLPYVMRMFSDRWSGTEYTGILNFLPDAIETATSTAVERMTLFGVDSREVREWVRGQDSVFSCSYGKLSLPPLVAPGMHPLIKADREYQRAAAYFYAGEYDEAKGSFENIASDSSSPWAPISRYLVARTLIRKATLEVESIMARNTSLSSAEAILQSVLQSKHLSDLHRSSRGLLAYVGFRLHPESELRKNAVLLLKTGQGSDFGRQLSDYVRLLGDYGSVRFPRESTRTEDELTDWLLTLQSNDSSSFDHAYKLWKKTNTAQWLVASFLTVEPGHSSVPALIEAARRIGRKSPAYPTVLYHAARLMKESGKAEVAKRLLHSVLSRDRSILSRSSLNLFLSLRQSLSGSLGEFLKFSAQIPACVCDFESSDYDPEVFRTTPRPLQVSNPNSLNLGMPLSVLRQVVSSPELRSEIKRTITLAVWVRSVLLDRHEMMANLVPDVKSVAPELTGYLEGVATANDDGERRFAATFLILHYPGLRPYIDPHGELRVPIEKIDNYGDNWWCTNRYGGVPYWLSGDLWWTPKSDSTKIYPPFLSGDLRREVRDEVEQLRRGQNAPNYLCAEVLKWAWAHPDDPRVPEALHLSVRATRFGCADSASGSSSKRAFQLLHKKYPRSEWARKTPYWFRE